MANTESRKRRIIVLSESSTLSSPDVPSSARHIRTAFPTPTSLESRIDSPDDPKSQRVFAALGTTTQELSAVCLQDTVGIPLIHGAVQNQLTKRRYVISKATNKKKDIINHRMWAVRCAERKSSFGPLFKYLTIHESVTDVKANSPYGGCIPRTPQLQALVDKMSLHRNPITLPRIKEETKVELLNSWSTIFHRIVLRSTTSPSIDTSYLAYNLTLRFSSMFPPARKDTRCFLYSAAAMLAFKFLEEDDPKSEDFHNVVDTVIDGDPTSYCKKRICAMEQRIMMAVDWRLGDIVLPTILTYALLDNISLYHRTLSAAEKKSIATQTTKLFFFLMQNPSSYQTIVSFPMEDIVAVLLTVNLSAHMKATPRLENTLLAVLLHLLYDDVSSLGHRNHPILLEKVRSYNSHLLTLIKK